VKKERELQKKLLKKERKTFRTVMKVSYHILRLISPTVSHFSFMLVNIGSYAWHGTVYFGTF